MELVLPKNNQTRIAITCDDQPSYTLSLSDLFLSDFALQFGGSHA